jgi:hypothetical protein
MLWQQTKPTTSTTPHYPAQKEGRFKVLFAELAMVEASPLTCNTLHWVIPFVRFPLQSVNSFPAVKTAIFKATLYVTEAIIVKGISIGVAKFLYSEN